VGEVLKGITSPGWRTILIFTLMIIGTLAYLNPVPQARGSTGIVYVSPAQRPLAASGTTLTFTINVSNIDPFNGWDIIVWTNQSFLNPVSVSINQNIFAPNPSGTQVSESTNCVNNGSGIPIGSPGDTGCTISDGPGIVHSQVNYLGAPPQSGPSSGVLINITYHAINGPGTDVRLIRSDLFNGSPYPISHDTVHGVYGKPNPDFYLSVKPPSGDTLAASIFAGDHVPFGVTLSSLGNFTGRVSLSAALMQSGLNPSFSLPSLQLIAGKTNSSTLTINSTSSTPAQTYFVELSASNGPTTHTASIVIDVLAAQAVIRIKSLHLTLTSATVGQTLMVNTTISNTGTISGTFLLQIIWKNYLAAQKNVTLTQGQNVSLSLPWDTTGFPAGTSKVTARVSTGDSLDGQTVTLIVPYSIFNEPLFWIGTVSALLTGSYLLIRRRRRPHKRMKKRT